VAFEKTVALGSRLDILFANIRTGFFYRDNDIVSRNIEKARRYRQLVDFSLFFFAVSFIPDRVLKAVGTLWLTDAFFLFETLSNNK
jgi:hypothetical protein